MKVLEKLPANQICLVCTGSQGEPMAALSRMANRDHVIRIAEGDTVLLASSLIPGNENAIYRVINELTRWGANVVHKGNAKVHVSGHASAGELVYCYNVVKPRNVMPVHGEWRHLRANGDLAIRTGVHPKGVVLAEDGVAVDLVDGRASITGKVPAGNVYVDGETVGGATEATSRTAATSPRRASSRSSPSSTPTPASWPSRRTSSPAASSHDDEHVRRRRPADREGAGAGRRGGRRRRAPARAAHRARRRPVGAPHLPPQPDDHPGRHRRLSRGALPHTRRTGEWRE